MEKIITAQNAPSRARRLAKLGSTIISTVRPNLKGFAFIENEIENAIFSTGFAILESKDEEKLLNKWLFGLFMYSDDLMEQMKAAMPKGQYPSINKTDIENFQILIPKIETQKSIIAQVNEWEAQIAQCEAKLSGSLNAKKAILEQYL